MLYKTTINILEETETAFLYPELRAAYNALMRGAKRREIRNKVGLESSYLFRLLNKKQGDEPMRAAYLSILKKELLGIEES